MIHSPKLNDIEVSFLINSEIRDVAYHGMKASYLTDEELAAVKLFVEETIGGTEAAQSILHKRQVFDNNRIKFMERQEAVGSDKFSLSE